MLAHMKLSDAHAYDVMALCAVVMCRGGHGLVTPPVTSGMTPGIHAEATEEMAAGVHVAARPVKDMPGRGAMEERGLAAVVMADVVGIAAVEERAAVEEPVLVEDAVAKVAVTDAAMPIE